MRNVRSSMKTVSRVSGPILARITSGGGVGRSGIPSELLLATAGDISQSQQEFKVRKPSPSTLQYADACEQFLLGDRAVGGKQAITCWGADGVENDLSIVRDHVTLLARDVTGDEPIRSHLVQKCIGICLAQIAPPNKRMNLSAKSQVLRREVVRF